MMLAVAELTPQVGLSRACRGVRAEPWVGVSRSRPASWDRLAVRATGAATAPVGALGRGAGSAAGPSRQRTLRGRVAPAAVFATLLDEGRYHGSIRTMYPGSWPPRAKPASAGGVSEPIRPTPSPELAGDPGPTRCTVLEDITKLKGPAKWTCFHLYVILDIFSRYVVRLAHCSSRGPRNSPSEETHCRHRGEEENITPGTLTLSMPIAVPACDRSLVAALLIDLDVAKTHSRPHVSG